MTTSALIGHTGFVGSNLARQAAFADCFNSKNIEEMRGKSYDLVVCAGVSAVKWWANKNPEQDAAGIARLVDVLATVRSERFVLISTIDVYPKPVDVDESTPLEGVPNHAYGTHRYELERTLAKTFRNYHVLRLPGLFGPGLKKNVIYDLMNDNGLDVINPDSVFQYYDLSLLWSDVEKTIARGLELLNVAAEPIATRTILERFFPTKVVGEKRAPEARYDMRSRFSGQWGNDTGYLYDQASMLDALGRFLKQGGPS